ncbi:carbonic anhydrase [Oricola thermophila]|uniref:Carbonic anhydrase n=1 Tax=Oricola thermophila TaxID=2742145 RepID=A0A6N1VGS5_9HYPH|nr:carbonic anhydrase [Oricola thermophila]QKV20101.1 carbonic anhydrase [Oricola thermophila]
MTRFPQKLLDGYQGFLHSTYRKRSERYRELAASGQRPEAMVIACCDSRAAPEIVFDSGPGEIFVLRNVANLVPPYNAEGRYRSSVASIEFAVVSLGVRHVVVMGHGRCGGVAAALDDRRQSLDDGDAIGHWISLLDPAIERVAGGEGYDPVRHVHVDHPEDAHVCSGHDPRQTAVECMSVRNSLANLRTFPYISEREADGRLTLHGAWFDISEGMLWIYDEEAEGFVPAIETHGMSVQK